MAATRIALRALSGLGFLTLAVAVPTSLGKLGQLGPVPGATKPTNQPDTAPQGVASAAQDIVGSIGAMFHPAPMSDHAPAGGGALAAIDSTTAGKPQTSSAAPTVLAYARETNGVVSDTNPALVTPKPVLVDPTGLVEAISAYRSGDLASGDQAAATTTNPLARTAAEWAALRLQPRLAGFDRIVAFMTAHPQWVGVGALRRRAEEVLYAERRQPAVVKAFFAQRRPLTLYGKLALARAQQADGKADATNSLVREVWREADLTAALEASIRKDFPDALTRADHKFRADRLFYKENSAASLRVAGYGGTDLVALAKARENLSDKAIAALPPDLRKDPTLTFARIQKLRRDNKVTEAAQAMLAAPRDKASLVAPDEWWVERRLIARKLIDQGEPQIAYKLAAEHTAQSPESRLEAEFHAGWIALRFLADPGKAAPHFATCASIAATPMSVARAAYWQGRAAEVSEEPAKASAFYEAAATHSSNYYGQLARARLGRRDLPVRMPEKVAKGDERDESIRVIELLGALEQKDIATPLAIEAVRNLNDEAQIGALAEVVGRARDARTTLMVGKLAAQRGFALDETAFPTFGIPAYEPLARSAPRSVVYAIARQESAFDPKAQSGAGAKGLMQMLTSTARRTAQHAGVPFEEARLLTDPMFNAQLGAAHLGELLTEQRGSLIMTFAAYNAGGKRVREWTATNGDPRDPAIDPVDWVERIPFTETRNYVQRVVENLEMYRVRFGEASSLAIDQTLRSADARP